jgi:hypothetical protein
MKYDPSENLAIIYEGNKVHEGHMTWNEAAQWILNETFSPSSGDLEPYEYLNYLQVESRNRPLENWTIERT